MRIEVKYLAQLKHAAGLSSETIEVQSPCTVSQLLRRISQGLEKKINLFLLDDKGNLHTTMLVFVDGELVRPESEQLLEDGETITLLPPMAGGR